MSIAMVDAVLRLTGVTSTEKLVLLALAENCRKGSPDASPGMEDNPTHREVGMITRTALSRTAIVNTTKKLADPARPGGPLLLNVSHGRRHHRGVWRLLVSVQRSSGATATTEVQRSSCATATTKVQRSSSATADVTPQRSHSAPIAVASEAHSGRPERPPLGSNLSENLSSSGAGGSGGSAAEDDLLGEQNPSNPRALPLGSVPTAVADDDDQPGEEPRDPSAFARRLTGVSGKAYAAEDATKAVGMVRDALAVETAEAERITLVIAGTHTPATLAGYVYALRAKGDLAGFRHRSLPSPENTATQTPDQWTITRTQEPCPHGQPGGKTQRTRSGTAVCPQCRRDEARHSEASA